MAETHAPKLGAFAHGFLALLAVACMAAVLAACSPDTLSSAYLQANSAALHRAASATSQPMQFVVAPGATARSIAAQLQAAGLITDARLFEAYVRASGLADKMQAGTYTLSPDMTPVQIAEALLHARPPTVQVTIPEGWRLKQVAEGLTAAGVMDGVAYRKIVETGDLSGLDAYAPDRYAFLNERPAGASLEGYLFPDTYELLADETTPEALLRRQLDTFTERVVPAYRKAAAGLARPLTLYQVLTLASIVEREASVDDERPIIAGVYLNRLAQGMRLEADPTVQYAMGYQPETGQWWKSPVYLEEYSKVLSPYNTYLNPGLPPGPIANPGEDALLAVAHPAVTKDLYFVAKSANPADGHLFAATYADHRKNVKLYRKAAAEADAEAAREALEAEAAKDAGETVEPAN